MPDPRPPASEVHETWTVKEVVADLKSDLVSHLNQQDGKLDDIDLKLDGKADKTDVVSLATEFRTGHEDHSKRLTVLEQHRLDDLSSRRTRNRVWAVCGSIAGVAAIIIGALIDAHIH